MEGRRRNRAAIQIVDLILHQGDQRRRYERQARQPHGGQLKPDRLPGSRRHDGEQIAPLQHRLHHVALPGAERRVPEVSPERLEGVGGWISHVGSRVAAGRHDMDDSGERVSRQANDVPHAATGAHVEPPRVHPQVPGADAARDSFVGDLFLSSRESPSSV